LKVPIPLTVSPGQSSSPQYSFNYSSNITNDNILSFCVTRNSTQTVLFDTSIGGLVLNNQFIQIVSRLQSPHAYGFGENNHETLKHNVTSREIWGIFPRDQAIFWGPNTNHYGTHPFYLVMEQIPNSNGNPSGSMHGVLLLNSNAMDYSFNPDPSVTIRTIGGIIDLFMFLGPSPEQVIAQYTWLIGRPMMPPYWSLGSTVSMGLWKFNTYAVS
jgi:alpha-glucosidase (family GH31 glycosyl hydrolase)